MVADFVYWRKNSAKTDGKSFGTRVLGPENEPTGQLLISASTAAN
jgi:hypothetical protein